MDPLSFTASIFTVISAIGVIGKGLRKLIALRHAPAILFALNDEVAGLYCVVQAVEFLVRQHAEIIQSGSMFDVCRALEKSKTTLLELEDLVQNKLTVETKDGERRLNWSAWLFAATKVQKIKDEIRADRIDLSSALSLLASSASLGVELQLQQLSFTIQTLGDRVLLIGGALSNQVQDLVYPRGHILEDNNDHNDDIQLVEAERPGTASETRGEVVAAQARSRFATYTTQQDLGSDTDGNPSFSATFRGLSRRSTLVENNDLEQPRVRNRVQSLPTNLIRATCSLDCTCASHRRNHLKSPDVLNSVLGSIIVSYKASPWSSYTCDKKSCQSRATKITYAFPQWLLRRAVSMTMAYSHPLGPDLCLRVARVCPGDADIFTAVYRGTLNHVQRLLGDHVASVRDVDPAHNTALHWAVRKMDLPIAKTLINAGSDMFYENSSGSFPYSVAWEKILGKPHEYKKDDLDLLQSLFSDRSELVFFNFSELHRACLGLSGKAFTDVLCFTLGSALDVVDNTGRTTLSWAAQRGDDIAVEELLKRGANPNRPDNAMKTPLHWSVAAKGNTCMVLLLQHGAHMNAKDEYGRSALSNVSSKTKESSFQEALMRFNADIETEDDEGWRPLHWAAHKDQPGNITQLLNNGADSNATDRIGRNPLHAAMLRNCHRAMKALLDNDAGGAPGRTALGSTTLHIVAEFGDIETLQILQSADLGNINIEEDNNNGQTAQMIAEARRDDNGDWAESTCQECDLDPTLWYQAWEVFMNNFAERLEKRGAGNVEGGWTPVRNTHPSKRDSSDWETIEEEDGKEVWEDALESTDGSCGPDSAV